MKVNLVSDMHLNFEDIVMPGGDVLIMAGDIMEAGHLRIADNLGKNVFLADRYRRFLAEEMPKYKDVIYVFGNHEHYHNSYYDTFDRIKAELPPNVHHLEAESLQIGDVHFFGATLWTDMNRGDPISMNVIKDAMSDFQLIKFGNGVKVNADTDKSYYTSKFSPHFAKSIFHETVEKLKIFLDGHPNDKVVVVTHHAPTELSISPVFKDEYHMNGAYHSRLADFILRYPQIKVWCHGHMHSQSDYMMGDTRILANPRGYKNYENIAEYFNPSFGFEV